MTVTITRRNIQSSGVRTLHIPEDRLSALAYQVLTLTSQENPSHYDVSKWEKAQTSVREQKPYVQYTETVILPCEAERDIQTSWHQEGLGNRSVHQTFICPMPILQASHNCCSDVNGPGLHCLPQPKHFVNKYAKIYVSPRATKSTIFCSFDE